MSARRDALLRWRLVLGAAGDVLDGRVGLDPDELAQDAALAWLYDRADDESQARDIEPRQGGLERSQLTVPEWIGNVHRLFPKETIERLERDAVERYRIHEVVTNADVLRRIEPNESILRAVLLTKHLMNEELLALAREIVARVVRRLVEELAVTVKRSLQGRRAPRRSLRKVARNFDARATIRENLDTWDRERKRLSLRRPLFVSRTRRAFDNWQIVLLVDESGSMIGSVIHAAVTAACLWGLPSVKTHLCIFDTEVVDLTPQVSDPVEILMRVQLGGGTDIGKAVGYASQLIETPRRTIVVLISDLFEGENPEVLVQRVRRLCEQGVTVLALAALDEHANPAYDRDLGRRLVEAGAHVAAMTPGQLVGFLLEKVKA